MATLNFFNEDIEFKLKNKKSHKDWVKQIINSEEKILKDINFIFCSDLYLHRINLQFLNHDDYTDIITFDRSENNLEISGDIYISIDRINENAGNFSVSFLQEFHRVMAHGILHLLGFGDKNSREKELMNVKENECLKMWEEIKSST